MSELTLSDVQLEQLAVRLADQLADRLAGQVAEGHRCPSGLVDAATVARLLGTSVDYVYRHADELGAVRIGDGEKPRLRFDPTAYEYSPGPAPSPEAPPTRRPGSQGRGGGPAPMLPIRGRGRERP